MAASRRDRKAGKKSLPPKGEETDLAKKASKADLAIFVMAQAVDKFGMPAALFMICLTAVWVLGDAKTQNDFIREVLFADVTHTRYVQGFFGALVALAIGASAIGIRKKRAESSELKRIAAEKTRLQQKLIEAELSHTHGGELSAPEDPR